MMQSLPIDNNNIEAGEISAPATPHPRPALLHPTQKKRRSRSSKVFHGQSYTCRFPYHGSARMTGTLYGPRKARINLAIQDNPSSLPILVFELRVPTGKLLQEIGSGLAKIALECEKKAGKTKLLEEPTWTMYCNGRKTRYIIQLLHTVSMGAGVLPTAVDSQELLGGELTYMRTSIVWLGPKDFETIHKINLSNIKEII